jgi:hypothetical protein
MLLNPELCDGCVDEVLSAQLENWYIGVMRRVDEIQGHTSKLVVCVFTMCLDLTT